MDALTRRARELRVRPTDAERRLWHALRDRGVDGHKFRRQRVIGDYIVDFVCLDGWLVVEVDGNHHAEQTAYDAARDRWLSGQGFRVLRFSDRDVLTELDAVLAVIWDALEDPHPGPPPLAGEGS